MKSARELYQDLQASIMGNQETSYNKLGSESKGLIRDIQKIDGGSLKDIYIKGMPSNYKAGGPVVNPTTAMPEAPMSGLANLMAMKGRENDSMLVHLSPNEVNSLNKISGNTMTINPDTGLPEGKSWLIENGLPMLASIAAAAATGGSSIPIQMAAAAAASGVANKVVGKSDEEAINSALLSGVTAGVFGGAGGSALKGVTEEGAKEAGKKTIDAVGKKAIEDSLAQEAISTTMPDLLADNVVKSAMPNTLADVATNEAITAAGAGKAAELEALDAIRKNAMTDAFTTAGKGGFENTVNSAIAPLSDVGETIKFGMSEAGGNRTLTDMLSERAVYTPLATRGTGELAINAYADKLNKDANKPFYDPLAPENRNITPIDTIPFTQTLNQPSYTEEDIVKNFYQGPGMNYFNQAYGQAGGQVSHMSGGGLSGLKKAAGDVKHLFFSNPIISPLVKALGKDPNKFGPKGSSQGGKGKVIRKLVADIKQQKLDQLQQPTEQMNQQPTEQMNQQPTEQMYEGGLTQFQSIMGNPALQLQNPNPPMQMAGGGMMGNIPPEILEMLKSQASAPAPIKGYDVLADINNNPAQQMYGGGMTGAGQSRASLMQALQPMLQAANQQSQQPVQMARGKRVSTEIVEGLRSIADGVAFEGRVKGEGDGMSDDIPFMIEGEQPALLARDEYVIPADVVAMVGNGSSDAGAEQFDKFLATMRQTKYGREEQPPETAGGLESLMVSEEKTPSGEEVEVAGKFTDMMVLPNPPWSVLPPGLNPEEFMYMYTDKTNGQHYFKNIQTRKYSVFGSGKL